VIVLCARCGAPLGESRRCDNCDDPRCYACDGAPVGVRDRRPEGGRVELACTRHAEPLTHFEAVVSTAAGLGGAEKAENIRAALEALTARPS
jgi:hypothetical protein